MLRPVVEMARNAAQSSLVKSSMALISGTVLTQAILFLVAPLLSRVFGVADFGTLANYNAWVAILALLSSLRYEHAIIVARDQEDTQRVVGLTAGLTLASFLAYSIAAAAIHFLRPTTGYLSQIYGFVLVIPIGVLAVSVSSAFVQLNVKGGRFKRLAVMAILQATTTVVAQVTLGLLHVEHGLIIGTIFGSVLSGVVLGTLLGRDDRFSGFRSAIAPRHLMAVAREYANFPRYALAADVLNVLVQQFAPVFVLALFSPTVAGLYAFAVRMVRVPLIVVSTAVSIVLRKEAVDHLNREESLTSLFTPVVWRLFLVGLIPFLMILLFGDSLFALVFGPQWAEAGRVVQILSPGILLEFVAFPLGALFIVTNSQRYTFVIQATGLVALLLALFIGKQLLNDFISTCYLLSAVMVGVNLWSLVLAHRVASRTAPHRPRTPWPVPASADPAGLADAGAAQAGIGQT